MKEYFSWQFFQSLVQGAQTKLCDASCGPSLLHQVAIVAVIFAAGIPLGRFTRRGLMGALQKAVPGDETRLERLKEKLDDVAVPLLLAVLLWIAFLAGRHYGWNIQFIHAIKNLLTAWVVIRLATEFLISPAWSRLFALSIWTVAAMDIMGVLAPTIDFLDQVGINLDGGRLSLLILIKTGIMLAVLLPLSGWLSKFIYQKIQQVSSLSPRVQVLLFKLLKTGFFTMAILLALDSVGFDFHLLAVVGGAIGIGAGFGLQKVVSNLVSGVIILMDNSIRPGDVIEVGGVYGWIESLHSRFVSVITRDGTSFLIPNDELISNKVINWSFSGPGVRLKIPVGISYSSDVHRAMELMLDAGGAFPRVLKEPPPVCRLIKFGDSSIELELRLWIKDPAKGVVNIKSDIQLKIWETFKEHGIEFPFPQQDLHLKSPQEITVRVKDREE